MHPIRRGSTGYWRAKEEWRIGLSEWLCRTGRVQGRASHLLERRIGRGIVVQLRREELYLCPPAKEIAPVAVYALLREVVRPEILSARQSGRWTVSSAPLRGLGRAVVTLTAARPVFARSCHLPGVLA